MSGVGRTERAPGAEVPAWRLRDRRLLLERPAIMGVLNVTPDSFSDGGRFLDPEAAAARAWRMVEEGADLVDLGAESSRPGAAEVPAPEEWGRLAPVLERLRDLPIPISVDTTKAEVARRAIEAGARAVNDISALRFDPEVARVAADTGAGLLLMHMRGTPRTMQADTRYDDLMGEVADTLAGALERARAAGCAVEQLVVDPGIGFGKSPEGNLEILARLDRLAPLGRPILVGPSRKSFIGAVLGLPLEQRLEATLAACVVALLRGARLFRVHDVGPARRALDLAEAVRRAGEGAAEVHGGGRGDGVGGRHAGGGRAPAPAEAEA